MPEYTEDPEASRPYFARLRELAHARGLERLSMGTTQDFGVAVQEGATIVRIGRAIFSGGGQGGYGQGGANYGAPTGGSPEDPWRSAPAGGATSFGDEPPF